MKNKLNTIKNKLASYIYIYIYRAAAKCLGKSSDTINSHSNSNPNPFSSSSLGPNSSSISSYIKSLRTLRVVGTLASAALLLVMTLAVYPITSKPNTAEALPSAAVASDTYLDITTAPYQSTASVALTVNSSTGTFSQSSSSEMAKFGVTTNNYTGYNLSIIGSDDTKQLINNTTSTALDSITSSIDSSTFSNPANTSYNGKWGYKPSKYNSTDNTSFRPAPTTSGSTIDNTIAANTKKSTATGDTVNCTNYDCNEYTIALGARADMGVKAGTYTNTFILTAVGNSVPYTLNFLDTSEDSSVSNMPTTPISGETKDTSIAIPTNVPVRTGYSFAGWCNVIPTSILDDTTSTTNPVTSGSTVCKDSTGTTGTIYQPSTTTTTNYYDFIDQTVSSNIGSLYALWNANTYTVTITNSNTTTSTNTLTVPFGGEATLTVTPASGYYLSNVSCPTGYTCSGYSTGTSSTSTQTVTIRNNNTTAGGTLGFTGTLSCTPQSGTMQNFTPNTASGYCESGTLTDTRDNQTYTVAKLADGNWWLLDNLRLGSDSAITLTPSNTNIASNWTLPASGTVCFTENSCTGTSGATGTGYTVPAINSASKDTINSDTSENWGDGSHKYGVYYNYCAVSAGTYCYASGSGTGNALYDICPKGWRMPTGGSSGEYKALYTAYSSNATNFRNALSTPLSGIFDNGSAHNQGSYGYFWSSTYYNGYFMYGLQFGSSFVSPTNEGRHYYGYSVRCLLDTHTPYEKLQAGSLSMQDIGNLSSDEKSTLVSQMTTGTSYNVSDSRDGESYKIAKLADDKVWLQDNLRLGSTSTIDLTPSNTNIASNWTLPASGTVCFSSSSCTGTSGATGTGYTVPAINAAYKDTTITSYGSGSSKIGVYYNYCAASAGTYCYAQNSGTGNASYDICPKGWRMPTSGNSGEYQALYTAYSSNATNFRNSLSTPLSGYFGSSAYDQGSYGYFWSSTYSNGNNMYSLLVYSSNVYPTNSNRRYDGSSVRCLLDTRTIADVTNMQDVTSTVAANTAIGESKTLTDTRDNNQYLVSKLADGNLWMLDNLRLGSDSTIDLTPSNTNIVSSWTLPTSSVGFGGIYETAMINTASKDTTTTSYGSGSGKIGVYYNYCAASAGTYCYDSGSGTGNASYDICPKGWRMPTGGSSGEYQALYTAYSSNATNFRSALSTPLSGYFSDYSAKVQGSRGNFWSSTYAWGSGMSALSVESSSVSPMKSEYRTIGYSVRCLAK